MLSMSMMVLVLAERRKKANDEATETIFFFFFYFRRIFTLYKNGALGFVLTLSREHFRAAVVSNVYTIGWINESVLNKNK